MRSNAVDAGRGLRGTLLSWHGRAGEMIVKIFPALSMPLDMPRRDKKSCCTCRERAAGYYAELAWAAGEVIVEIPYLIVQTCLYSVITYFMIWFEINAGETPSVPCHMHHDEGA